LVDGPIDRKRWPPSLLASIRNVSPGTVEELFSCMQGQCSSVQNNFIHIAECSVGLLFIYLSERPGACIGTSNADAGVVCVPVSQRSLKKRIRIWRCAPLRRSVHQTLPVRATIRRQWQRVAVMGSVAASCRPGMSARAGATDNTSMGSTESAYQSVCYNYVGGHFCWDVIQAVQSICKSKCSQFSVSIHSIAMSVYKFDSIFGFGLRL
jgi:hypothetical protein